MSEAVLSNLDVLVTKNYLDARLDVRFSEMEARFNERFLEIDARFNQQRTELSGQFRLLHTLLTLLLAGVFIPQLQMWFGGA